MFQNIWKLGLAAVMTLMVACGGPREFVLAGTERAVGADGMLVVEELEGNRMLTVTFENLPPPARVSEGATAYAVWIQPEGATPSLAGHLEYDEDARTGMMRATTPHSDFKVLVTAETDPAAVAPSEIVVARQEVRPAS